MSRYLDLDAPRPKKRTSRRRWLLILAAVLLLLGGGLFAFSKTPFVQNLLAPISFVAQLVQPVKLTEVSGRVNVLVLGLDTRTGSFSGLTDTMLIGSFSPLEGQPALISIPRDFWLNLAPYGYGKINTAYNYAGVQAAGRFDEKKALEFSRSKIEEVLGIKIPYWVVINFEGFKEVIDTLGGVTVDVDTAFQDCAYPTPNYGYKCISFKAGPQLMNGEKALEYARSRKGTNGSGSDFSRTRRQQKVILAVKDRILSFNLLLNPSKLSRIYQQISSSVRTNASFAEIRKALEVAGKFADLSQIRSLVLDPESGLVYHPANPAPYGGAYVIVPKSGGFAQIQAAVHQLLFGSEAGKASDSQP